MGPVSRREWMGGLGAGFLAGGGMSASDHAMAAEGSGTSGPLALKEFQPKSMLHVKTTRVERARFPVIDVHSHLSWTSKSQHGVAVGEDVTILIAAREAVAVMDRKNVKTMINLTGGHGKGLARTIAAF